MIVMGMRFHIIVPWAQTKNAAPARLKGWWFEDATDRPIDLWG